MNDEMKHTPGPWTISRISSTAITSKGERGVATTGGYQTNMVDPDVLHGENDANARRIVECVNAMEGVDHPAEFMARFNATGKSVMALIATEDAQLAQDVQRLLEAARKAFDDLEWFREEAHENDDVTWSGIDEVNWHALRAALTPFSD